MHSTAEMGPGFRIQEIPREWDRGLLLADP